MNTKTRLLCGILIAGLSLSVQGQTILKKGKITFQNADPVKAYIDVRNGEISNDSCIYSSVANGFCSSAGPEEVLSYEVDHYISKHSRVLRTGSDSSLVYMDLLFDGIVDLYRTEDDLYNYFLLERYGYPSVQISDKKKKDYNPKKTYRPEDYLYMGDLKTILDDRPELFLRVEQTPLTPDGLIKLLQVYQKQAGAESPEYKIYRVPGDKAYRAFSLHVRPAYSVFSLTGVDEHLYRVTEMGTPAFGFVASKPLMIRFSELHLEGGLNFEPVRTLAIEETDENQHEISTVAKFSKNTLRARGGLRYNMPAGRLFFSLYAGPDIAVNMGYLYTTYSTTVGTPVISLGGETLRYPGFTFGGEFSLGLQIPLGRDLRLGLEGGVLANAISVQYDRAVAANYQFYEAFETQSYLGLSLTYRIRRYMLD